MNHLCEEADAEAFPALNRLREARGTEVMPGPLGAAEKVVSVLDRLKDWPSGSFVDIRQILAPAQYASLYGERRQKHGSDTRHLPRCPIHDAVPAKEGPSCTS